MSSSGGESDEGSDRLTGSPPRTMRRLHTIWDAVTAIAISPKSASPSHSSFIALRAANAAKIAIETALMIQRSVTTHAFVVTVSVGGEPR